MRDSEDLSKHIGNHIRDRRQRAGMTLHELSEQIGVSIAQVQKYELGVNKVPVDTLYKLQKIFNMPISLVFDTYQGRDQSDNNDINISTISQINKSKMNILLVEDNSGDEYIIRKFIEECEYPTDVYSVHDGVSALDLLRQHILINAFTRPDIIILDLSIPKKDGHTVLKEIKRDERLLDIPVIIVTNSMKKDEMLQVYRKYASGYICKSGSIDVFKSQIQTLIKYWSSAVVLPRIN